MLFCLIADYIKGGNTSQFLDSVIYDTHDDNASIYNITLACREIAEIWEDFNLNPELVYCDEEEVFRFIRILRDLHFIIQQDSKSIFELNQLIVDIVNELEVNHNTHVEPVELTESTGNDQLGESQPVENYEGHSQQFDDYRMINQDNLPPPNNFKREFDQNTYNKTRL